MSKTLTLRKSKTPLPKEPRIVLQDCLLGERSRNANQNKDFKQQLIENLDQQMLTRQRSTREFINGLSRLLKQHEESVKVQVETLRKIQYMAAAVFRSSRKKLRAAEQNVKTIKRMQLKLKKKYEKFETKQKEANTKIVEDLEEYMTKLQQKLTDETKKQQMETMKRSFLQAMSQP